MFLHSNFPGQFFNLAPAIGQQQGNQAVFITAREDVEFEGVKKVLFRQNRTSHKATHHYIHSVENTVSIGQAVYRAAAELKKDGFVPDVIIGHCGWGNTLFMKDLFPKVPVIGYFEWFFRSQGEDADFFGEQRTPEAQCQMRTQNASLLTELYSCDYGITPTRWQHSQFPKEFQKKIQVLHDGVRTDYFKPFPGRKVVLPQLKLDLSEVDELVTYVARGMEPCRGFPQFMEAISLLQRRRPRCHVMILGQDRVAYGSPRSDGKTYKQVMLETLPLDLSRIHFTGLLPYYQYAQVLQASSAHVYLTRPFVLSWSMLEAMSTGCLLVASDTPPVREFIQDGENGVLVDFFSPEKIAARLEEALEDRINTKALREKARQTIVEGYSVQHILPAQLRLLQEAAGRSV